MIHFTLTNKKLCFLLVTCCSLYITQIEAQDSEKKITYQQNYWIGYHNQCIISPHWNIYTEIEERRFFPDRSLTHMARINLNYKINSALEGTTGFAYFLQTTPQDPAKPVALTVPELRPHAQFTYTQRTGHLTIQHRYRAEWRFFRNTANNELVSGYHNNFRFRYRLQADYAFFQKENINKGTLRIKLSDEVMFNAGKEVINNTFDQNRIYAGINYQLWENISLELGYLKWFQQRSSGIEYYDRDILRFTILHRIKL